MKCMGCGVEIENGFLCAECKKKNLIFNAQNQKVEIRGDGKTLSSGKSEFTGSFWSYVGMRLKVFLLIIVTLGFGCAKAMFIKHEYMCKHTKICDKQIVFDKDKFLYDKENKKTIKPVTKAMTVMTTIWWMLVVLDVIRCLMLIFSERNILRDSAFYVASVGLVVMSFIDIGVIIPTYKSALESYTYLEGEDIKYASFYTIIYPGVRNLIKSCMLFIGSVVFCVVTLGIGFPFAMCWLEKYKRHNTIYNGRRLHFNASPMAFFWKTVLWDLLCVVTLGIYVWFYSYKMQQWKIENTKFIIETENLEENCEEECA